MRSGKLRKAQEGGVLTLSAESAFLVDSNRIFFFFLVLGSVRHSNIFVIYKGYHFLEILLSEDKRG